MDHYRFLHAGVDMAYGVKYLCSTSILHDKRTVALWAVVNDYS